MSSGIVEAVYTKLTTDQGVGTFYNDLGGRIYVGEAPINATMPLCVLTYVGATADGHFGTAPHQSWVRVVIQIDLWSDFNQGMEAVGDIDAKLWTLLHGATMSSVTGYDGVAQAVCLGRGVPTTEEHYIRTTSEWQVEALTS